MARYLAQHGVEVTGVDSSETMISMFRRRIGGAQALVCDMRTLHLERAFQGVIAWDSFFHLTPDDQRNMFAIFRRHSARGASLMFTSGPEAGEAIGELEGEPLYHASLAATEYRARLAASGFVVHAHVPNDPGCGGRTVWLAQKM